MQTNTVAAEASASILAVGYAKITLDDEDAARLHLALKESQNFFSTPPAFKHAHASSDYNHGYRPLGQEYSVSPDRPDMNECFTLWSTRTDLIPDAHEIDAITGALLAWRAVLMPLLDEIFTNLAKHFGSDLPTNYQAASYMQVNNYVVTPPDRDLLQDKHEDGHMVTIHHATAPGLEIWPDSELTTLDTGPNDILIMPGSVLTTMSGGELPPLYHQVRNLGLTDRQALMYFVNPELSAPLYAWTDASDEPFDVRDEVRNNPGMFGLPVVPEL